MGTIVSGGGFNYELISVGGRWTWRVVADNIKNSGQYFYVTDINTPFGPLYTVNSPIPADVVTAMSNSLNSFANQLSPVLYLSSSSSINVSVSEGDTITSAGIITVLNTGALGSFLSVSATNSDPWILVNPSNILGLGKNQPGAINVQIDPTLLLAVNSPYSGVVNLQNLSDPLVVIPVSLAVTVLPRPQIALSASVINFTYDIVSNTVSGPLGVDVTNSGPLSSILSLYVSKIQDRSPWLNFTPALIENLASGSSATVTFSINVSCINKIPGVYSDTISFASYNATNSPGVLTVQLTVT
jgi:hypothetical protein